MGEPDYLEEKWNALRKDPDFTKKTVMVIIVWLMFIALGAAGIVLFFIGFFFWPPLELPWEHFAYGAGIGGVILLLLLGVALAVKRLLAKSLPLKVALLTPIPVGAVLVFGFSLMFVVNGAFDFQGTQEYETVVVRKILGTSNAQSGSSLEVSDFRPGRGDKLITVQPTVWSDGNVCTQARLGDRIIVEAGKGVFGWWYRDIRLVE